MPRNTFNWNFTLLFFLYFCTNSYIFLNNILIVWTNRNHFSILIKSCFFIIFLLFLNIFCDFSLTFSINFNYRRTEEQKRSFYCITSFVATREQSIPAYELNENWRSWIKNVKELWERKVEIKKDLKWKWVQPFIGLIT